jgi:hypothetical protein
MISPCTLPEVVLSLGVSAKFPSEHALEPRIKALTLDAKKFLRFILSPANFGFLGWFYGVALWAEPDFTALQST